MLTHSALGCCWHHEHIETTQIGVDRAVPAGHCEHRHEHAEAGHDAPAVPSHEHVPCDQGQCVSLMAKDVRVSESAQLVATLTTFDSRPASRIGESPIGTAFDREDPPPGESGQLRARLQVWRI